MRSAVFTLWVDAGKFHAGNHLNAVPLADDLATDCAGEAVVVGNGNGFHL